MKVNEKSLLDRYFFFLFIFFVIFFYFGFITGKNFIWEDALYIFYPGANYFATTVASGKFPLWLPSLRAGMPFFSDIQMGVFYPLNYLLPLFVNNGRLPFLIYQIFIVFHIGLGGYFFYLFLRINKFDCFTSTVGATIFSFSGFMALHIIHVPFIQGVIWWPLAFYILKLAVEKDNNLYYFLLSPIILVSFLPGNPQCSLYLTYFFILYWIYIFLDKNIKNIELVKKIFVEVGRIAVVYIGVLALGAIFFLPGIENWYFSTRETFGFKEIADQSLPFKHLIQLIVPNFFGVTIPKGNSIPFWGYNKDTLEYVTWHAGAWQYWEFGFYPGQLFLIAIFITIFNFDRLKKENGFLFFLGSLILALWFMLGRYGGLFNILYHILPGISMFRTPARMAIVFDFTSAIIVAYILSFLFGEKQIDFKKPAIALFGTYIFIILIVLIKGKNIFPELSDNKFFNNSIMQLIVGIIISSLIYLLIYLSAKNIRKTILKIIKFSILVLVFSDFYIAYSNFHKGETNPDSFYSDNYNLINQLENLRKVAGQFRFAQLIDGNIAENLVFPRNMGCFYKNLEVLEGYVLFLLKKYDNIRKMNSKIQLDLFNTGAMVNFNSSDGKLYMMIYTNSLPRVKFYNKIKVYKSEENIIFSLNNNFIDYKNEIAVTSNDIKNYDFLNKVSPSSNNLVSYKQISPEKIIIDYNVESSGIIFISQTFYPGWRTNLKNFVVIPVFAGLTGIVVPNPGKGQLILFFKPQTLEIGKLISATALILWLIIMLLHLKI